MYPIMLNISQFNIIVIGGGKIATRKVQNLLDCGAQYITIVSDQLTPQLQNLVNQHQLTWQARVYQQGDIVGFHMVLLCTNQITVNQQIAQEIKQEQLFNDATNKENSNFFNMPYFNIPEGIVAVSTFGKKCATSKKIRNQLQEILTNKH